MSKREPSKGKKIKPHFWVFCEGETEEAYIRFLRSEYRIPIEIIPKIAGCDISNRYIQSYKQGKPTHQKDKDFLIYDADVPDVLNKLNNISSVVLILSNPAIELWFLLHYKNQITHISKDECIRQLKNRTQDGYKKGIIVDDIKEKLKEKCNEACKRSRQLQKTKNPSSNMFLLIEALEDVKNGKL